LHGHDTTGSLVSDLEDGEVLIWIVLVNVLWDDGDLVALAGIFDRFEVKFLATDELCGGNLRESGLLLVLQVLSLFELHGKFILFPNSLLSFDNVPLRLVVEVSEAEENDDEGEKNDGDHDNDPRCLAIIGSLNLNDSWIKLVLLHNLLNGDVLVYGLLLKNGLDVGSEDRLSSGNSVDIFNVFDDSVGLSCGDYDWVVTFSRDSTI